MRGSVPAFGAALNATGPDPDPLAPPVMEIHGVPVLAVQSHPFPAVTLRPPLTLLIQVDRFLPTFVDVKIENIEIVEGGLAVRIGAGGATPPVPGGKR